MHVHAVDPVSAAGLASQLRSHPGIEVVDRPSPSAPGASEAVAVVAIEQLDEAAADLLRRARSLGARRIVLVCLNPASIDLIKAIDLGVCAILSRSEASMHRLVQAVVSAAAGEAAIPADLLGRLLDHVARIQHDVLSPRGLKLSGLADREAQILSRVADGMDTKAIALELNYSERTVKNVLHDVTSRYQLRNRPHAVAFAVREGLI